MSVIWWEKRRNYGFRSPGNPREVPPNLALSAETSRLGDDRRSWEVR